MPRSYSFICYYNIRVIALIEQYITFLVFMMVNVMYAFLEEFSGITKFN